MSRTLKSLCVFCGSREGANPAFARGAEQLGRLMARRGIRLVYGGGGGGLMGIVARSVLAAKGDVIGVVPQFLRELEVQQDGLNELHVTKTMHERKAMMYDRSDAFAVMPGGIGTIEEVAELLSWRHLGVHTKPIVVVNLENYWAPYLELLQHIVKDGFAAPKVLGEYTVVDRIEDVLPAAGLALTERAEDLV